jgi:dTDP-4-dehydrorhamnose reductase
MKTILFTGGSGLLGQEMQKLYPNSLFPTSSEVNVANYETVCNFVLKNKEITTIVHCAAFTSPPKVEKDPIKAIDTNIIGTCNIVKVCAHLSLRLIYISTDYVFDGEKGSYKEDDAVNPVNKYAWSKLGGECAARLYDKSLIVRLSFGPSVFPYGKAYIDQWTSRIPVNEAAEKISRLINNKYLYGIIHIGSDRKTVYDYAKSISPEKDIEKANRPVLSPKDTSLDTTKYNLIIND